MGLNLKKWLPFIVIGVAAYFVGKMAYRTVKARQATGA
jgi:hypothetical protein